MPAVASSLACPISQNSNREAYLWMELKSENVSAAREGLIEAERCGGKAIAAIRQIEGVAVPVEDGKALQGSERMIPSSRRQVESRPPISLDGPG